MIIEVIQDIPDMIQDTAIAIMILTEAIGIMTVIGKKF
jgi:hypothetical protein